MNDLQTAAAALRQAAANRPMNALLAPGEAGDILEKLLSGAGSELRTVRTPFVAQKDFDKLLWASDTAIIRGEDKTGSKVRQRAGTSAAFCLKPAVMPPDLTSGAESSSCEVIWHGICSNVQNWACEKAIYSESRSPEISKPR